MIYEEIRPSNIHLSMLGWKWKEKVHFTLGEMKWLVDWFEIETWMNDWKLKFEIKLRFSDNLTNVWNAVSPLHAVYILKFKTIGVRSQETVSRRFGSDAEERKSVRTKIGPQNFY